MRKVLGDPLPRFHDMRHTCVSLLLAEGAPPHVVQQIVGHSAIDVTMTIYRHASLDEKRTALQRLGTLGMTGLLSHLLSIGAETLKAAGRRLALTCGFRWWAGAGSNRRPSTFQAPGAQFWAPTVVVNERPEGASGPGTCADDRPRCGQRCGQSG